jgi:hypothetical protein
VEVVVGEEGRVGSENDQGSVQDIDDIEHAPDEREPDGDAAVEAPSTSPFTST